MCGLYDDKINRITFDLNKYDSEKEMFEEVARVMQALTRNDEVCVFFYEDCGIYILQHNYADAELGRELPYWMTEEEYSDLMFLKEERECLAKEQKEEDPFLEMEELSDEEE